VRPGTPSLAAQDERSQTDRIMASRTRYARSGDLHIAYRTLGAGPVELVVIEQWFSNVEVERDVPPLARFNDRLASFGRLILFDKRGVGLSDPVPMAALPPIEDWMDDLRAVMDAVGAERAAVIAGMAGGFMASVFAATHPDRVSSLVPRRVPAALPDAGVSGLRAGG
jgi:pimeloyl-ACP methyl ester carboxylesterase